MSTTDCTRMEANLDFYDNVMSKSQRVAHRYKLVRFEDVAMSPTDNVRDIYKFIGHSPTDQVYNWVASSTTSSKANGAFGTNRDSKKVVSKWRQTLDFDLVKIVQENCAILMARLDYVPFHTIDEYRNQSNPTYISKTTR